MTDRSIVAYEHYRDASQRFEYFILGVSGALCAYIGQHLTPHKIGLTPYTLELLSLFLLVGSVFVGFKRIEKIIACHVLNQRLLYSSEQRGQLVTNFKGQPLVNALSGESLNAEATTRRISELEQAYWRSKSNLIELPSKVIPTTRFATTFLLLGFSDF